MNFAPNGVELEEIIRLKFGPLEKAGWGPRLRNRFQYFNPEDWYEALVLKLVGSETRWLDVGCGRSLFPHNSFLCRKLSRKCKLLVGVDSDPTIQENTYIHEKVQVNFSDYKSEKKFDLVTLRMVAEHMDNPHAVLDRLSRLTAFGGIVVIYTIFKWSPIPILTKLIPFRLHHPIKKFLWKTECKDTFPVAYKMNTRTTLKNLFEGNGFSERYFAYIDDCNAFGRFYFTSYFELSLRRILRKTGLCYPEVCLLSAYQNVQI